MMIDLRYADDIKLLVENRDHLTWLLMKVKVEAAKAGLQLNIKKKKKVMATEELCNFKADMEEIEIIHDFLFLGPVIKYVKEILE